MVIDAIYDNIRKCNWNRKTWQSECKQTYSQDSSKKFLWCIIVLPSFCKIMHIDHCTVADKFQISSSFISIQGWKLSLPIHPGVKIISTHPGVKIIQSPWKAFQCKGTLLSLHTLQFLPCLKDKFKVCQIFKYLFYYDIVMYAEYIGHPSFQIVMSNFYIWRLYDSGFGNFDWFWPVVVLESIWRVRYRISAPTADSKYCNAVTLCGASRCCAMLRFHTGHTLTLCPNCCIWGRPHPIKLS